MPEASAARRNRWYRVKWPDQRNLSPAWAEKYFDNHTEAFDYFERRRAEHPTGRVHRPVQSHEKPTVWAVCWTRCDRCESGDPGRVEDWRPCSIGSAYPLLPVSVGSASLSEP